MKHPWKDRSQKDKILRFIRWAMVVSLTGNLMAVVIDVANHYGPIFVVFHAMTAAVATAGALYMYINERHHR